MQRLAAIWNSGRRGKAIIGCSVLLGVCMLCSIYSVSRPNATDFSAAPLATSAAANRTTTPTANIQPSLTAVSVAVAPPITTPPRPTDTARPTNTTAPTATSRPSDTPRPTATTVPTDTAVPPTNTPVPPTATPIPPTATPLPPTATTAPPPTAAPTQPLAPPPPAAPKAAPAPTSAPSQAGSGSGSFAITVRNEGAGLETVTVTNTGGTAQDLGGWEIRSYSGQCALQGDQTFTFPAGFTLAPGASVNVYSAYGNNPPQGGLLSRRDNIWDNTNDKAELVRPDGSVAATHAYGRCR